MELLTAAAHIRELQDKLNSTAEALHLQKVLNQHLQLQISSTSQECTTDNLEVALTLDKILQQEERVPGLFLYYTNMKYPTFVTLLEFLTCQQMPAYSKKRKDTNRIDPISQLLLTLMRLRHNFGVKDLAARFAFPNNESVKYSMHGLIICISC